MGIQANYPGKKISYSFTKLPKGKKKKKKGTVKFEEYMVITSCSFTSVIQPILLRVQ